MQPFEAPISLTKKGMGFVSPPGTDPKAKNRDKSADLLIPPAATLHALHGDLVRVEPTGMHRDPSGRMPPRAAGKVVAIIARAREHFVGTLVEDKPGHVILEPDYKRMHLPIEITASARARPGDKVLVRLTDWPAEAELPQGVVEEVIGKAGEHDVEMRALALGAGFRSDFPPGVAAEARRLEAEGRELLRAEAARRVETGVARDFRAVPTMTIDPADAKDFDDALSVRRLESGLVEVGVHIADVSFFVTPGSALDREARERATSVYLVDRTIPMLPEILSTDLCSLNPAEDRLAVSAVFTLDEDANVTDRWFGETVIHSDRRYTYEDAQQTLDQGAGDLHDELATLHKLSEKIRARRSAKGAIEFDTAEVKVRLDERGTPIAIELKERKATNLLIEDFMLLANEAVAEHLSKLAANGGPHFRSLYRVHDAPDPDRIENLAQLLRVMGHNLAVGAGGKVSGAELNRLLEGVKGTPEEYLVKTATLRSMAKAVYTTDNIGHFGLAFDFYTHFTSPIRRYPDLVIHRLVKSHAGGNPVTAEEMAAFDTLALHCSEREVGAAEAERDSIKMKQVEFLAPRIGEVFDAVISGVSERGAYVEEQSTHADGMIRITDLGNDYLDYDERHYRLVGRRTGKAFQLGDPIKVRLVAARPMLKELDFVPA
ncbi:MAG: ribonuclease R [Patescibacteria group bacterium]|nr:ribonuclease R [Patescibacteria group bacterium]